MEILNFDKEEQLIIQSDKQEIVIGVAALGKFTLSIDETKNFVELLQKEIKSAELDLS